MPQKKALFSFQLSIVLKTIGSADWVVVGIEVCGGDLFYVIKPHQTKME